MKLTDLNDEEAGPTLAGTQPLGSGQSRPQLEGVGTRRLPLGRTFTTVRRLLGSTSLCVSERIRTDDFAAATRCQSLKHPRWNLGVEHIGRELAA